jgi:hypothetical protein
LRSIFRNCCSVERLANCLEIVFICRLFTFLLADISLVGLRVSNHERR